MPNHGFHPGTPEIPSLLPTLSPVRIEAQALRSFLPNLACFFSLISCCPPTCSTSNTCSFVNRPALLHLCALAFAISLPGCRLPRAEVTPYSSFYPHSPNWVSKWINHTLLCLQRVSRSVQRVLGQIPFHIYSSDKHTEHHPCPRLCSGCWCTVVSERAWNGAHSLVFRYELTGVFKALREAVERRSSRSLLHLWCGEECLACSRKAS